MGSTAETIQLGVSAARTALAVDDADRSLCSIRRSGAAQRSWTYNQGQLRGAKQGASTSMGDKLTPEELAEFREIFNLVDKDGGGTISKEELASSWKRQIAPLQKNDLMIAEIDEDNTSVITSTSSSRSWSGPRRTPEQVPVAFRVLRGAAAGHIKA